MSRSSASEPFLDLATCNNPQGWPAPPLPSEVWQRLPANNDDLEAVAAPDEAAWTESRKPFLLY